MTLMMLNNINTINKYISFNTNNINDPYDTNNINTINKYIALNTINNPLLILMINPSPLVLLNRTYTHATNTINKPISRNSI